MLGGEDGKDNYANFMESFSSDGVFFGVTSGSNNIVTEDGTVGRKSIIYIAADGTMKKAFNVLKDAILPTVKMSQSMFMEPIEVSRREEGNPFGFHRYFINPYEMSVDEHPSGQQNLNNGLKDFGSMLALTANDDDHILYSVSTQSKSVAQNGRVRTTYEALTLASHGDDGRRLIKTKNVPVNSDLFELIVTGLFTGQNGGPILATTKDSRYDDIKIEIFDRNLNAQCHYSYKDGSIVGDIKVIRDKTVTAFYKHDGKPFWTTQDTPCGTQYEGKRYSSWVHSPYSKAPTKIITNRFRKETYIIGAGEIVRLDENFNEEWVIRVDRARLTTGALLNDGSLFLGGYKNLNNGGSTLWYGKLEKVRPPKPGDHIPVL